MLWPMLLDYSRNECKRYLRKLELEAYASIISAFRAQGELSKDKKKMLQDLCSVLSISMERHKAEIRRAVNDEKLNTIADRMVGPNTATDWAIEGRRLVPLMPRLVPQTAFTTFANNLANLQAAKNAILPVPSATGQQVDDNVCAEEPKSSGGISSPLPANVLTTPVKGSQQVVSLTSPEGPVKTTASSTSPGTPKMTNTSISNNTNTSSESGSLLVPVDEQEENSRKRKRSISLDLEAPQPSKVLVTSAIGPGAVSGGSASPVIMTSSSTASLRSFHGLTTRGQVHKTTIQGAQGTSKVILVSGTSGSLPPSILQRCLSVPMTGKVVSTLVSSAAFKSTATSTFSLASSASATALNTVSSLSGLPLVTTSSAGGGNMLVYTTTSKPRSRTGSMAIRPASRPRTIVGPAHGLLGQPGGPGAVQFPTPPSTSHKMQSTAQKPATTYLRTPGMKILSQMVSVSPARPRATQSPVAFEASNIITKPAQGTQTIGPTPRIVNVMSVNPSGRSGGTSLISTKLPVPSKLGQAIASRISSAGGGAKPNVIVVHKAQVWPQQQQQQLLQGTASIVTKCGQTYKDIMTYSQKHQAILKSTGGISVIKPAMSGLPENRSAQTTSNTVTMTSTSSMPSTASLSSSILELDPSQLDEEKNTLLADLIHAAGISPDASAAAAAASVAVETFPPQMQTTTVTTTTASSACPVSLVSSVSTTPCISQVAEDMEENELEDTTTTNLGIESSSALQLDNLSQHEQASLSQEVLKSTSTSKNVITPVPDQSKGKPLVTGGTLLPKSTASIPLETKTVLESEKEKVNKSSSNQNAMLSVQEIEVPVDQLHGGQVLEIQAPDTAALLNSDGQLSKEVLEILHQAGFQLQNEQVTIDTSGLELPGPTMVEEEDSLNDSTQLDPASGLVYIPTDSDEQNKGDLKDETMPSIVSVFSTGVLPSSQLDLENLHLVEDVLVDKPHESSGSSTGLSNSLLQDNVQVEGTIEQVESVLEISGLHTEFSKIEGITSKTDSVIVESTDKSYVVPNVPIDNIIEVGSNELVISGEEIQVDNTIMTDGVLVTDNDFGKNSPTMDFM